MSGTPDITVVVCTNNRAGYLRACVASLLEQSLPRNRYEILVVDNASVDETRATCAQWVSQGDIRYVYEPVAGLSQARNTGWREARGRLVGYLDDDGRASHGWLAAALQAFAQEPAPGWVGGPIDLDWAGPPPSWLDEELQECLGRLDWGPTPRWLEPHERLGGGNSFYPRELLAQVGGFDTRLGRKGNLLLSGEETQLQRRLEAGGHRLFYHPGVRMLHAVPPERLQPAFFRARYYWGGVTDTVIRKTLGEGDARLAKAGLPSAKATGPRSPGATLARIARHTVWAIGLGNAGDRVRGRIYWSYVTGRVVGLWRWHTEGAMRSSAREALQP